MSIDATRFVWKLPKSAVTPIEKLLLLAIADRCGERGECWPSISRLEQDTNIDRRTIIRHRNKLLEKGILVYTGEMRGARNLIPVMRLMVQEWREGDYVENYQSFPATGHSEAPVATKDTHQCQDVTSVRMSHLPVSG